MADRKVIFGTYDTAQTGAWTLAGLELTSPDVQTNLVQIPGRDGPLDMSTVLTNGEPVYGTRKLTVVLENSDGDRAARTARIRTLMAQLDGYRKQIWLPDDADHYLEGRLRVVVNYNDLAHASVTVTATCDPWLYSNTERSYSLTASSTAKTTTLANNGRKPVVPVIVVSSSATLVYGSNTWTLSAGTYKLPDFVLASGSHSLKYSGSGTIKITYREAVLL